MGVSRIWRMQKGDMMLELNQFNEKSVDNFCGKGEEVRARKQEKTIECKDLNETTSREDIWTALK